MTLGDFTPQADAYARARPHYPESLAATLIARLGLFAGDPVVEYGAGSGQFTTQLSAAGLDITAVEPNEAMRSHARSMPGVTWIAGTFEQSFLGDNSQAWAVAAQAFHWADPPRALPEIRRVLRPGGSLTVLWNDRRNADSELLTWTVGRIAEFAPEVDMAYRERDWGAVLTGTGDFTDVWTYEETHSVTANRERYLNLWRSHHRLNTTAPEGARKLLAAINQWFDDKGVDEVEIPYCCRCFTVKRA